MSEGEPVLLRTLESGTLWLTLNRPHAKNAIDWDLRRALLRAFEEDAAHPDVRAVVVRGAGRTFCAGGDIRQMGNGPDDTRAKLDVAAGIVSAMTRLPKPIVAGIEGAVAGAGLGLAFACDIVVSSDSARFHPSFVQRGLGPDMSSSFWLTRQLGLHAAKSLLMLGRPFTPEDARRWGLVTAVWDEASFDHELHDLASTLAGGPTVAYGHIKALIGNAAVSELMDQMRAESEAQLALAETEDHRESIAAFQAKRSVLFHGR